jgi:hypothetical protein
MHCSLHGREIMGLDRWLSGRGIRVFLFLFLFFKYGELKVEKWIGSGFVWFMAVLMESAFVYGVADRCRLGSKGSQ